MSLRFTEDQYEDLLKRQKSAGNVEEPPPPGKLPNKYHAEKVTIDGIPFDSKKEGARYQQLKMLERAGQISNLTLQKVFELSPAAIIHGRKKPPLRYIADFVYVEKGQPVVEDCKGFRDAVYKIKRHLVKNVYGLDILET